MKNTNKHLPNLKRTITTAMPEVYFFFSESEDRKVKHGKGTVKCLISYAGKKSSHFSTRQRGYRKHWHSASKRFVGKGYDNENAILAQIEMEIALLYQDLRRSEQTITAKLLKDRYTEKVPIPTLKNVYTEFMNKKEELHKQNRMVHSTLKTYRVHYKKMLAYLKETSQENLLIHEVGTKFCNEYHNYIIAKGLQAERSSGTLKRVLDFAKLNEYIKVNPFYVPDYTATEKKDIVYLTEQEVFVLKNYKFANEVLANTADLFLFQIYTGLAYCDMVSFDIQLDTYVDINEFVWIRKKRQKTKRITGETARLPLFPEAFHILEKYNNKLPIMNNAAYNRYLKEIAALLNIKDKKLTTHVARKTAGFIWLNKGLDYETVAAMLGHANINITQKLYAKVLNNRLSQKLQEVDLARCIDKQKYQQLVSSNPLTL
jgi:integrase/recombinase XerD